MIDSLGGEHVGSAPTEPSFRFKPRDLLVIIALAGGCCAMYLPGIAARGPWTAGEARAITTPRVMLDRGEWIEMRTPQRELVVRDQAGQPIIDDVYRTPALLKQLQPLATSRPGGQIEPHDFELEQRVNIHKPIGYYWLILGLSMLGMPVNLLTVRLTSTVSAILLAALVYLMGAGWFSRRAGAVAAVALATGLHFEWIARVAKMDMVLTLLLTAAFGMFWLAHRGRRTLPAAAAMAALIAGSVLIKGPGYLGIPALIIIIYLLLEQVRFRPSPGVLSHLWRSVRRLHPLTVLLLIVLLAAPFYVLIHIKTGGQWTNVMFLRHHLARFGVSEYGKEFDENTPFYFYLYMIWPLLFPWSLFIPGGIAVAISMIRAGNAPAVSRGESNSPADRDIAAGNSARPALFLLVWFVFMLVFFSAMKFRKDEYFMPAYPAAALLVGLFFDRLLRLGRNDRPGWEWTVRLAYVAIAIAFVGLAGFVAAIRSPAVLDLVLRLDNNENTQTAVRVVHYLAAGLPGWLPGLAAAGVAVLAGLAVVAQWRGRRGLAVALLAGITAVLVTGSVLAFMDRLDPYRSQRAFAQRVTQLAPPEEPVVLLAIENHELVYWLDDQARRNANGGRPVDWQLYDMSPIIDRSVLATQPDAKHKIDRFTESTLAVFLSKCRWWAARGRSPYIITSQQIAEDLLARDSAGRLVDPVGRWFEPVMFAKSVNKEYQAHRAPLALLRFRDADK